MVVETLIGTVLGGLFSGGVGYWLTIKRFDREAEEELTRWYRRTWLLSHQIESVELGNEKKTDAGVNRIESIEEPLRKHVADAPVDADQELVNEVDELAFECGTMTRAKETGSFQAIEHSVTESKKKAKEVRSVAEKLLDNL